MRAQVVHLLIAVAQDGMAIVEIHVVLEKDLTLTIVRGGTNWCLYKKIQRPTLPFHLR